MNKLTKKQVQAYHFIRHFVLQNGVAPTEQEIADGLKIRSRGVVHRYVQALEQEGLIQRIPNRKRNIELVADKTLACCQLPILGKVTAGKPVKRIQESKLIDYSQLLLNPDHIVFQVTDDALTKDFVQVGDYIVCEQVDQVGSDELAVISVDDTVMLRYLVCDSEGRLSLRAIQEETPVKTTYPADQVTIHGKYKGLIRVNKGRS